MTIDAGQFSPYLAADGSIKSDVPCWKCGYNLRTAAPDRECSECGEPVGQTINNLLAVQPATWLTRLAAGAMLCVLSVGLTIVSVLVGIFSSAGMMPAIGQTTSPDPLGKLAVWLAGAVPHVSFIVAIFVLSSPHPASRTDPSRFRQLRLRAVSVLLAISFFVQLLIPTAFGTAGAVWSLLFISLELTALVFVVMLLRDLLRRARRPRAVQFTTFLIYSGIALMVTVLFGLVTTLLFNERPPAPPYAIVSAIVTLPGPAGVQEEYLIVNGDGSISRVTSLPTGVPVHRPKNVGSTVTATMSTCCAPAGLLWIGITTAIFVVAAGSFWQARRLGERLRRLRA